MLIDEMENTRPGRDKRLRKFRVRGMSDNHKKRYAMPHDGRELVRLVANSTIVCDGDPAVAPDGFKPLFVRGVGYKVICMALHSQTGFAQNLGKFLA